ncbi:MAG TPA: hypothetical protein VIF02_15430 [Methylocella sp.]|jgi:hypothetical protein
MSANLPAIPVVDTGEGGLLRHAELRHLRARALREDCLTVFPHAVTPLLPALDGAARRWLTRSCSPYVPEIEEIAAALGFPGVWLLNGSYQWACTSLACEENGVPWLARTLDWPYPGLGRNADVVRTKGHAGDYYSVTWPGYAGVLTAMAPRRFAACINQAPMWRRTRHPGLRLYDLAANALHTWANIRHIPPDQLLRWVFEICPAYAAAKIVLENTPVGRPVIYTLIGCAPGERCVIERTENGFSTREENTSAANDWVPSRPKWEARIAVTSFLTCSSAEAAERSRDRQDALAGWCGFVSRPDFAWVKPPVLNHYTRLAVTMSPAQAILRVAGYEITDADLPEQVTEICEIKGQRTGERILCEI